MGNSQFEQEEKNAFKTFSKRKESEIINYFNFLERNPYTSNKKKNFIYTSDKKYYPNNENKIFKENFNYQC